MHLIVDWHADGPALAAMLVRLAVVLPDAIVVPEPVMAGDTLAAGVCVARHLVTEGRGGGVIAHDVRSDEDDRAAWPGGVERFCMARGPNGMLVVGATVGWAWSAAIDCLTDLHCIDVPADGVPGRPRAHLAEAIVHASRHHEHAVGLRIPRAQVPSLPRAVATAPRAPHSP